MSVEPYEGDWIRVFDAASIPAGLFNERLLRWINGQLVTSYTNLPEAMQAYATSQGAYNWSSLGLVRAQSAATPPLQTLTTEASATPTTTLITLATGENGLRIFTDQPTAASEAWFYLYVSKNGGAVRKYKMGRWTGRIIPGAAGDTFALGTSDGRALKCQGITVPAALATPSGATGTANCDQAGPPLWEPTAAHVVLPTNASTLVLKADGAERIMFIRERAPSGTWTPTRWVRMDASRDTVVQCSYTNVALANYAGTAISIAAPTGATIGGTKTAMSIATPTITGTTHSVSTVAQLKTAIAAAVKGDEIVLATGTYSLDVQITNASFTANQAAGNKGPEGILIRSASGNRADVTISGNGTGTNGNWALTMVGGQTMSVYAYFKDITFDFGATANQFSIGGGKYKIQNCRFTGGTGDSFNADCSSYQLTIDLLYCRADTAGADCWNFSGNATYNASSQVRLIDCEGLTAGSAADAQCLTSHLGLAYEVYGGTYSDANTSAVANDATTTPGYLFFSTITAGTRKSQVANGITLFGCTWTGGDASGSGPTMYFCRATTTISSTTSLQRSVTGPQEHNIFAVSGGRAIFNSLGGGSIIGNLFLSCNEAIRLGNAAGAVASTDIKSNTAVGCTTAYGFIDVSNMPAVFKDNAAKTSGTSVAVPASGMAAITSGYNVLDPTVSANFTAATGDVTGSDGALDSSYFPTAAGNCDGTGDTALYDYVGDSDPWGFVFLYKNARSPKGCRDIPAILASADLYPDFF